VQNESVSNASSSFCYYSLPSNQGGTVLVVKRKSGKSDPNLSGIMSPSEVILRLLHLQLCISSSDKCANFQLKHTQRRIQPPDVPTTAKWSASPLAHFRIFSSCLLRTIYTPWSTTITVKHAFQFIIYIALFFTRFDDFSQHPCLFFRILLPCC
jgi:hypothetical protein